MSVDQKFSMSMRGILGVSPRKQKNKGASVALWTLLQASPLHVLRAVLSAGNKTRKAKSPVQGVAPCTTVKGTPAPACGASLFGMSKTRGRGPI